MKRCSRCDLIFHLEERTRCIYCDTLLMTVQPGEETGKRQFAEGGVASLHEKMISHLLRGEEVEEHARKMYLIGSYFKSRTFHFMYSCSRNQYKMGRGFSRFWIQPLAPYSLLMVPWVVFDFIDSIWMRLTYSRFCEDCHWKFNQFLQGEKHDRSECDYNREYSAIIDDILKGNIGKTEAEYRRLGRMKADAGKHSAYYDLCSPKRFLSWIVDVACVWFSVCLLLIAIVVLIFPTLVGYVKTLE